MKKNDIVNISPRKLLKHYSYLDKDGTIKWIKSLQERYKYYIVLKVSFLDYVTVGCIDKNVKGIHYSRTISIPLECLVPYGEKDVFIDLRCFV